MAMNAEHKSNLAALYRYKWRLHMIKKFLSGTISPKQTKTQTFLT